MFEEMPKNFKPIRDVYPGWDKRYTVDFADIPDNTYVPLLESMGFEKLLQEDESGYHGDSFVLFGHGEYRGILIFGWGSCPGCDALEGCLSYEDIDELRDTLFDDIRWFKTGKECLEYLESHDWEGEWVTHIDSKLWDCFHSGCRELLAKETGGQHV